MSEDDRSYFETRAEQELRMARAAGHPEAARAHSRLAGIYLDRIHADAEGDESHTSTPSSTRS